MIFNSIADEFVKIIPSVNYKEIIRILACPYIWEIFIKLLNNLLYLRIQRRFVLCAASLPVLSSWFLYVCMYCTKIYFVICCYNYWFNKHKIWLTSKLFWNDDSDKLTKNLRVRIFCQCIDVFHFLGPAFVIGKVIWY